MDRPSTSSGEQAMKEEGTHSLFLLTGPGLHCPLPVLQEYCQGALALAHGLMVNSPYEKFTFSP